MKIKKARMLKKIRKTKNKMKKRKKLMKEVKILMEVMKDKKKRRSMNHILTTINQMKLSFGSMYWLQHVLIFLW